MCISIWFVIRITYIFQGMRLSLHAMKVTTLLDKFQMKFSLSRILPYIKLCNSLLTLVPEYSMLIPLTLEDGEVLLPSITD